MKLGDGIGVDPAVGRDLDPLADGGAVGNYRAFQDPGFLTDMAPIADHGLIDLGFFFEDGV